MSSFQAFGVRLHRHQYRVRPGTSCLASHIPPTTSHHPPPTSHQDAAEGKKVLEFVMRFLDRQHRWLGSPVAGTSIAVLQAACEQEHQRYLLFSTLLRHVAVAEQLSPAERAAVLQLAVQESGQLEPGLAAPALLLALRELPAVIATHAGAGEEVPPMPQLGPLPLPLPATPAVGQALEAAADGAVAAAGDTPMNGTVAGGAAAAAAATAVPGSLQQLELATLRGAPNAAAAADSAAAAAAAAAARGAPVDLQPQVLAAVQQLAVRVEDSGQLLEAIGSTVTKLRGQAPISTAALQCCVAAGQAAQHLAPRVRKQLLLGRSALDSCTVLLPWNISSTLHA